ncbi:penicillin-binding protein 2 [Paenibacillus psychroresistens]|uniref:Penicillin-binding protein 2 n=1 Tax=Paenibacillus psychroresistens TaxID=1778678 RepID=A0A6B8RDI6_9BACL|nr:penicillin-binding transpeptidase domain-containing protein [Paenibacillus psychroresistens]QGQ94200.1 penicillin-binding protein 2 [Paenibacillus psychroresistens]
MKHQPITEEQQKKESQKRRHFNIRINVFFFFTFLLFSILIVQLARLQFVDGKTFSADEKRTRNKDITIAPIRGNIYDFNGAPIAYTISSQSIFYNIQQTSKEREEYNDELIALAKQLEQIFLKYGDKKVSQPTASAIIKSMDVGIDIQGNEIKPDSEIGIIFVPRRIKTNLTKSEIAFISEHRDELKGIEISEESTRFYDTDITDKTSNDKGSFIAPQLIGYMRPYNTATRNLSFYKDIEKDKPKKYLNEEYVGFDGLELLYQDDLRGTPGSKTYPVDASAQIIGQVKIKPPEKGHNLWLTIDKSVQVAAQKAVAAHLEFLQHSTDKNYSLGNKAVAGYAVAIEVETGRVMAMVSMPDYDPNLWIGGMTQTEFDQFQYSYTNGTIRERYANLPNRASSLVPPGSTLKPLTVLVGLKEKLITPTTIYPDSGTFYYGKDNNSHIGNSDGHSYGSLTPARAIAVSSNTFMGSQIGAKLYNKYGNAGTVKAIDVWDTYMKSFGLGILTGSNLPYESEGLREYVDNKDQSAQASLVFGSFGQAARYTTLQLAQYTMMLANHGKRYRPQFIDTIKTYDGQVIKKIEPELLDEIVFPDEYWKVLADGMSKVSYTGFEDVPNVALYKVNRKTGTSEQSIAGKVIDNAVFIAYAPADHPKLAVAIVVPEGGFGRLGAGPIARPIFDAYDQAFGLDGVPKGK